MIGGERVVLDEDLATLFGVETKRLNKQVRRNGARFEGYARQLTGEEFLVLRSQIATSRGTHGGRRYPPWVFTEHGVVSAATVLNSDTAVAAMKLVVEVFVAGGDGAPRLQRTLEALLEGVVDHRSQTTDGRRRADPSPFGEGPASRIRRTGSRPRRGW